MTETNRTRFMANNHLSAEGTSYTFTSEKFNYPFTNALNDYRGKYWKPGGNFTIGATNNKLYIEYVGTPVTVTIPSGDYQTAFDLWTEINDALDLASCPSINFNYSYVTGKFEALGATVTDKLILSNRVNAIWDTIGFTSMIDVVINPVKAVANQIRSMTSEKITIDFGYGALCRFFSIISPLEANYSLSPTSVVTIKANNVNDFTTPPFVEVATRTDGGHFQFFDQYTDLELTYRYWQIEIDDKFNKDELVISYIYLGDYVPLTSSNINNGFVLTLVDPSSMDVAESGTKYFDIKTKYYEISNCTVGFLETEDRESLMQLFYEVGIYTPFFISLDPQLVGSSSLDQLTKYVYFKDSPQFKHIAKDVYTMNFELSEVV